MKKLTKVELFLLQNAGERYNSYRCPVHGVYQLAKTMDNGDQRCRGHRDCQAVVEVIADPKQYLTTYLPALSSITPTP